MAEQNVICYVDGFNLYHGLRSRGWRKYYWLDLWALTEQYLRPAQRLVEVVYCTARVKKDVEAQKRQAVFIDALTAFRPGVRPVYGHYLAKQAQCFSCGSTFVRHEEKMTDVNIACALLMDAMDGRFDVAFLMSGDSDLVPPVKIVRQRWPEKRIVALFPPNRKSDALRRAVHGQLWIAEANLRRSLLPDPVEDRCGRCLSKPKEWV
jgi:uncharacterized LabA/DUF88 family protein